MSTGIQARGDGLGQTSPAMLLGLNIFFISMTLLVIVLRMYSRICLLRAPGIDDYVAVVAAMFCLVQSSLCTYLWYLGAGLHVSEITPANLDRFYVIFGTMTLLLFWTSCAVRLAIVAFLPRLSHEPLYLGLVHATGIFSFINSAVCFCIVLNECHPIRYLFYAVRPDGACHSRVWEAHVLYSFSAFGIVSDISLTALPIWIIIKNLRLSRVKALQVSLIFGAGIFSVWAGVMRLVLMIKTDITTDITYSAVRIIVSTDGEIHVGFWVACVPALQPLIRSVAFKLGWRDRPYVHPRANGPRSLWCLRSRMVSRATRAMYSSILGPTVHDPGDEPVPEIRPREEKFDGRMVVGETVDLDEIRRDGSKSTSLSS